MIFHFIFGILLSFTFAQEINSVDSILPKEQPVQSTDDLKSVLQREYAYLVSQKESLSAQKSNYIKNTNAKNQSLQSEINNLQKVIVNLTADNDDNHEYLASLEKRKKEMQKRDSSIESTFKKANKTLAEFESSLKFEKLKNNPEIIPNDDLSLDSLEELFLKSQDLLQSSVQTQTYDGAFLNLQGELVEGKITRLGRAAAIGNFEGKTFILGPNGEGLLKALEQNKDSSISNLFLFESISKEASIKKQAGFVEKLADLSPIIFLGMILLLIAGLFTSLIRI